MTTAEEYIMNNTSIMTIAGNKEKVRLAMVEFAKLHVQEALSQASEKARMKLGEYSSDDYYIDEYSILNAYSLENIK